MTESENLSKWQDSGQPHIWVWQHIGAWSDEEYAELLATLRAGPSWPLNEVDIMRTLHEAAQTYHDLKRWHLLGNENKQQTTDVPASPDDEIWF